MPISADAKDPHIDIALIPVRYSDSLEPEEKNRFAAFWPDGNPSSKALAGFIEQPDGHDFVWVSDIMPTRDKRRFATIHSSTGSRSLRIRFATIESLRNSGKWREHIEWVKIRCIQKHDHDEFYRLLRKVKRTYRTRRMFFAVRAKLFGLPFGFAFWLLLGLALLAFFSSIKTLVP